MITAFRRYLETWVVRGFFLIMVLAFISWGVGDVVRMIGTSTWVAKVGGQTIEGAQLQDAYQREMAQATRNLPAGQEPSPGHAQQRRARGAAAADHPGGAEPGAAAAAHRRRRTQAVRQMVFAMPAFHGPNGQFDQQTFEAVLRNNGLTEPRFLDMVRGDLAQQQLLGAVSAGAATPDVLLHPLFERAVREALRRHGGVPASPPRPSRPRRPTPSCSAGTTTTRTSIRRRNTAGSRRSCCRRRRWRRTSTITDAELQAAYRPAQGGIREAGTSGLPR